MSTGGTTNKNRNSLYKQAVAVFLFPIWQHIGNKPTFFKT